MAEELTLDQLPSDILLCIGEALGWDPTLYCLAYTSTAFLSALKVCHVSLFLTLHTSASSPLTSLCSPPASLLCPRKELLLLPPSELVLACPLLHS
jgi:hypothetical protein